ncbi:PQQ-dependent catabolism-associated CXXCW motif protein [Paracoccus sp. S1E-3]|uniref:PQQ-dependent catabolism-associated CXXCW motif protein n=1 Tax=Paracoccus sp. S1E-3 TaxID=2756130 RepID=UPI001C68C4B7|nr:PQQ-dependent catabolism-associated CXXCW motif protein [Paracoccus sp. S1E-3]
MKVPPDASAAPPKASAGEAAPISGAPDPSAREDSTATKAAAAAETPPTATVPEPDGFRAPPYRERTPATLAGATVIDAEEARKLHAAGTPFIDVFPRKERPANLPEGTIFREEPYLTIPGAIWLHDTGYEGLNPVEEARLRDGLALASNGDMAAPMVIFCRRDCWLSWNAAKRAVGWGYTGIRWLPDGIEGWQEAGGTLEPAEPPESASAQ